MPSDIFESHGKLLASRFTAVCGKTFQLQGDATTTLRVGVLDRHRRRTQSQEGGLALECDATLVCDVDEFSDVGLPACGKRLKCDGATYVIQQVDRDEACATLYLLGVNQ